MVYAYISNSGSDNVSVINTATNTVSATIAVGHSPQGVAVTADGTKVYVANSGAATVSVIDTGTNTVSATISFASGSQPLGIAVTPDGTTVYVTQGIKGTVSVIDTGTNTITATITLSNFPAGIAVTPDGAKVYVTEGGTLSNKVAVINTSTNTVSASITVGTDPGTVAITPNGTQAYVTNNVAGTVSVIDIATNSVSATVTIGTGPFGVAISPDGTKAYVTYGSSPGGVAVVNTSTHTVSATLSVGSNPQGVAFSPDGTHAYVPCGSNEVLVINTATQSVSATIPVGNGPASFGQFIQPASFLMTSIYTAPQGRLTLTSNTPVMTADVTPATSVYYTPYQGNIVPIYDGANMQSYTFSQLTMTLSTLYQTSGHIYDLFVFLNSSIVTIAAGPAWNSSTSRGTGAGTTQLQQIDGLWVNANSLTAPKNGSTTYSSIPAGEATYVGSVYMTANGETGMQFNPTPVSGGAAPVLGVYNAYNRVGMNSINSDAATSWTYTGGTWENAHNNVNNRVSFIDGLAQSYVDASYCIMASSSTTTTGTAIGIGITGGSPSRAAIITSTTDTWLTIREGFSPLLGLNYIQAMEIISLSGGTGTYTPAGGSCMLLSLFIEI